jgi:hypothetical protein
MFTNKYTKPKKKNPNKAVKEWSFKFDVFHPEVCTEYVGQNVSVKHNDKMLRNNTILY